MRTTAVAVGRGRRLAGEASAQDVEKELATLKTESAARAKTVKKLRADLDKVDAERRKLDQQRGDSHEKFNHRYTPCRNSNVINE